MFFKLWNTFVFEIETQFQSKVVEQLLFNHFYCLNKTKTPPNTCIFVFKWLLLDPNKAYEHYKPIGNLSEMYWICSVTWLSQNIERPF